MLSFVIILKKSLISLQFSPVEILLIINEEEKEKKNFFLQYYYKTEILNIFIIFVLDNTYFSKLTTLILTSLPKYFYTS